MSTTLRCDIFCTVIDNFGDAGVCWRLARQLAKEYRWEVRLFIDQADVLAAFLPDLARTLAAAAHSETGSDGRGIVDTGDADAAASNGRHRHIAVIDGVTIAHWPDNEPSTEVSIEPRTETTQPDCSTQMLPDVVIEAFACELPASYLTAMAQRARAPVWINLEYLSAEDWVRGCHLGRSQHPRLGLDKTFFFPGMTSGTGGVLREHDLDEQRRAFLADPLAQAALWQRLGVPPLSPGIPLISLFAYENPALDALLPQWAASPTPIALIVPTGRISAQVEAYLGSPFAPGVHAHRGNLHAYATPFVTQADYDRLLWLCDLNFVRGEDSFVRAQWAERPFVWHIYPQTDDAHLEKLDAALRLYCASLAAPTAAALSRFWQAWNGAANVGELDDLHAGTALHSSMAVIPIAQPDWGDLWHHRDMLAAHAPTWSGQLQSIGSLAANLAELIETRLK